MSIPIYDFRMSAKKICKAKFDDSNIPVYDFVHFQILPIPVYDFANTSIQYVNTIWGWGRNRRFWNHGESYTETCLNIGSRIKRRCKISTQFLPLCKEMLPENGTKRRKLWSSSKEPPRPWGQKKLSLFFHKYFLPCLNRAYKCALPWENVLQGCFFILK